MSDTEEGSLEQALGAPMFAKLARIRDAGWEVAVHNDYRLDGKRHTFWLFTKDNRECVKGEGRTDDDALDMVIEDIYAREADAEIDRRQMLKQRAEHMALMGRAAIAIETLLDDERRDRPQAFEVACELRKAID